MKYNSKFCSICRRNINDTTTLCYATDMDTNILDPTPEQFKNLVIFNKSNVGFIEYKLLQEERVIEREILEKHQKIFKNFVKDHILQFRYEIIKSSSEGKASATIFSCDFHSEYSDLSLLYILKGTKKEGLNFFKKRKITSVMDLIKEHFKYFSIFVNTDHLVKKNYIRVYF